MRQLSQTRSAQRGLSFIGLLFMGAVLAFTGVVMVQVVPTVIEYQSILKAANTSKVASSPEEVRSNFDKNKATSYFDAIGGKDLDIAKENDRFVVSFAYIKEIHLVGPAFLLLKYSGKTN